VTNIITLAGICLRNSIISVRPLVAQRQKKPRNWDSFSACPKMMGELVTAVSSSDAGSGAPYAHDVDTEFCSC
jgi:hypothetical protein